MTTRPGTDRKSAQDGLDVRPGTVYGREWWGWDRDRLEDELARQERGAQAASGRADHPQRAQRVTQ
jgi:hypothetical protein